ncbi:hypothetical protein GQ53DRAFT_417295 [Thozetella sp. PMI_491]|nr:hypothetical protein GQ53DRAFT_417295 [Thozetella sp. PMI_491]
MLCASRRGCRGRAIIFSIIGCRESASCGRGFDAVRLSCGATAALSFVYPPSPFPHDHAAVHVTQTDKTTAAAVGDSEAREVINLSHRQVPDHLQKRRAAAYQICILLDAAKASVAERCARRKASSSQPWASGRCSVDR